MKLSLYVSICYLFFNLALRADSALDLVRKSAFETTREEFELVMGDLNSYDCILIYPESPQISVIKINKNELIRKYWRAGIPKDEVMIKKFEAKSVPEIKKSIENIFKEYDKSSEKSLKKGEMFLYKKDSTGTWKFVKFSVMVNEPDFKYLYSIMLPPEDVSDPKEVEEFLQPLNEK